MTMTAEQPRTTEIFALRLHGEFPRVDGVECVVYKVPHYRVTGMSTDPETGEFVPGEVEESFHYDIFQDRFAHQIEYKPGWVREPYQDGPHIYRGWGITSPRHNHAGFLASAETLPKALQAAKRRIRKMRADEAALAALKNAWGTYTDEQYARLPEAAVVCVGDLVAVGALGKWRVGVVEKITKTGNATIAYITPSNLTRVHRVTRLSIGLRSAR